MTEPTIPTRLIEETLRLVAHSFTEVVPADAQIHFLNAQRELLLGMAVVIEHNTQRSLGAPSRSGAKRRGGSTRTKGAARTRKRPAKIELD